MRSAGVIAHLKSVDMEPCCYRLNTDKSKKNSRFFLFENDEQCIS